jgi:ABC-type multidrug transport system permease subunit
VRGLEFVVIAVFFGLSAGVIGKIKGSSFWLWFLIGTVLPLIGTLAAIVSRWENRELRRRCEECGNVVALHDQVCTRCGRDLEWPSEALAPRAAG